MRLRLLLAYDGTDFHGMAAQKSGVPTVAGRLADALGQITRGSVDLTVAGRTDAGVHAWGQVVVAELERAPFGRLAEFTNLRTSLNKLLGPSVVVRHLDEAPADFDARRSARRRRYRYTVLNRPVADPFRARTAWHLAEPLDLRAMQLACDPLIGLHDFASFCRRPQPVPGASVAPTTVRRVFEARWDDLGEGELQFTIEASAFCHQMVRALCGTIVDMGRGRRRAGEMTGILAARNRASAGSLAPPQGLCLWAVTYDPPWP
jgi:tRNA pseudouridine38-40 synthase